MDKTETLYGRQEVANDWLDRDPNLAHHVAERMHEELGKALADKICDGKLYRVKMEKPHIEIGDVGINQDCSVFRSRIDLAEVVMCQDCKFSEVWESTAGNELYCEKQRVCPYDWGTLTAFYVKPDDFCSCGEREGK